MNRPACGQPATAFGGLGCAALAALGHEWRTLGLRLLPVSVSSSPCLLPACAAGASGAVALSACAVALFLTAVWRYWRTLAHFWAGGSYEDAGRRFGLSRFSCAHLYSLASVPWLMSQPHYRTGTFQEDMHTNLRNVVLPTGVYGVPLSFWAQTKLHAVFAICFVIPAASFLGSCWRRAAGLEESVAECFQRSLLAPTDWFQLWRLNCRLASMTALATGSKDFELEDKWVFIRACMEKKIPVTPVMDQPVTLVAKDVLEEGGMGIHVLKNVLHGGRWILQERLDNCAAVNELLPPGAPLSTMRVLTGSMGALSALGMEPGQGSWESGDASGQPKALCTVWRAGRQGASTDHSCVMVNVPGGGSGSNTLGRASSSAHWYACGLKSLGMPASTQDGSITAHPDTGLVLEGRRLPGAERAAKLCEEAHAALMPTVPLAGWDVAFCPPKSVGSQAEPELVLLEANLSCNFFRGHVDWDAYASLLDAHFAGIDRWRRRGGGRR